MARIPTNFNPATKEFEAYLDFSGGQNSAVSNERLADYEFIRMENVDNSGRGSAKTRYGRVVFGAVRDIIGSSANGQGLFNYYLSSRPEPIVIAASDGQLFGFTRMNESTGSAYKIPITDGTNTDFRFQTTLPVEAAQYGNKLYVATGTKLVELLRDDAASTWTAKTVTPYQPTVQEAIYIGTNALATNPDQYIQDGTGTLAVTGIKPGTRQGSVGTDITMTAYINRPSNDTGTIEYKWEYKKSTETSWTVHKDFTANEKTTTMKFSDATKYDVKVTIRKSGSTTPTPEYSLTGFTIAATPSPNPMDVSGIQRCRKILLHWDRLLMCGDDKNPYQMYISHLQNPAYFPVSNTINFDYGKQEPITAALRFQDMLVVFTKSTIQTLTGKSTEDYARYLIHDGLGCVAGRTAAVVGNNIFFMSHDGMYALKPNPYRLETMNVGRIDQNILREIDPTQTDACAMVHDSQYWLCYPKLKVIYRYHFERKVWVKDVSSKLNFSQFLLSSDDVYNLTTDGWVYLHNRDIFTDAGEPYQMVMESKYYDLSASFNNKKLKRLYILGKHALRYDTDLYVTVKADSAIALTPEGNELVTSDPNGWYWQPTLSPNFEFLRGTAFGTWVVGLTPFGDVELSVQRASIRGKCRRVKIIIEASSRQPCEIYGFAFQFKLKKV